MYQTRNLTKNAKYTVYISMLFIFNLAFSLLGTHKHFQVEKVTKSGKLINYILLD